MERPGSKDRTKGWLEEKRKRKQEAQARSDNFFWGNHPDRLLLQYRVELGKPHLSSIRDRLHQLLTTTQTAWQPIAREDAQELQRGGYNRIRYQEVYASLRGRVNPGTL